MTAVQPVRSEVRRAAVQDRSAIAAVLAAAFHADPVFEWVLPDPARRAAVLPRFFALTVDALAHHDDTWTTGRPVLGAALWVPSGQPAVPEDEAAGFGAALVEVAGRDGERMLEVVALLDEHHPADPHEYLWFLGVTPQAQGRGIGSALMGPVFDRADPAGEPAYLEATSARSKALYERHGFVAQAPISVPGGPPIWPMWRRSVS